MRITDDLCLIASGRLGFAMTDSYDCNVYAVRCGDEWVLIDSGAGRDVDAMLHVADADGIDVHQIKHVLLTHGHADHAGGCAALQHRQDVTVWASADVAGWVSQGDETAISLDKARTAGGYPADYRFSPCPVQQVVVANQKFVIGTKQITPIATPGHADGHLAYLMQAAGRSCLFVGDLILCGGAVLLQYTWDCSIQKLGESLLRLNEMQFDALFPGHFHFALSGGRSHLQTALQRIKVLLPPMQSQ